MEDNSKGIADSRGIVAEYEKSKSFNVNRSNEDDMKCLIAINEWSKDNYDAIINGEQGLNNVNRKTREE